MQQNRSEQFKARRRVWLMGGVGVAASAALMGNGFRTVKVFDKTAQQIFADARLAALAEAAALGQVAEVQRLVQAGVPVDGPGLERFTPLAFALLAGNAAGVEALLKLGANPNHRKQTQVSVGGVPLILYLQMSQRLDLLELMLRYGADPNSRQPPRKDNFSKHPYAGLSILQACAQQLDHVKLLVKYGADVNFRAQSTQTGGEGNPAITQAAALGNLAVVEFLLEHGAKVDLDGAASRLQALPVKPAIWPEHVRVLRKLQAKGAKIYKGYRPVTSPETVVNYVNQDLPPELLSEGYYEPKLYTGDTPYSGPMD